LRIQKSNGVSKSPLLKNAETAEITVKAGIKRRF
jgi:hypothetical protein